MVKILKKDEEPRFCNRREPHFPNAHGQAALQVQAQARNRIITQPGSRL
jgi:hypothetical protein